MTIKSKSVVAANISVELLKREKANSNFDSLFTEKLLKRQKLIHGVVLMDQNVRFL